MDQNQTYSAVCSTLVLLYPINFQWPTYLFYSIVTIVGFSLNALLMVLYFNSKINVLGNRAIFKFLLQGLAIVDFSYSVVCATNFLIIRFYYVESIFLNVFFSFRNINGAFELYILLLISIDRLLAVVQPTSTTWSKRFIVNSMICFSLIIPIIDFIFRFSIYFKLSCSIRSSMRNVYVTYYGISAVMAILMTIIIYSALFIMFLLHI